MTVLVVGAGPSGLAALKELVEAGHDVIGVERHDDVGGIWDIDRAGTPMYESAHMNSSKTLSALDGLPMPDDYPDYPSHRQLLAYLRAYAEAFDLRRHIRFGTSVDHVTPRPGGGWTASLSDGDTLEVDDLVLAVGLFWNPNLPDYPGEFTGEATHSRDYRSPSEFAGRRVLIVGAGNSGCDIACDAAMAADAAFISMRRGYRFVPKYVFGKPADVFAAGQPTLPGPIQQRVFDRMLDTIVGDVTAFGLPRPDHHALSTHPILNTRILDHLGHGDIAPRPDIDRLDGSTVHFVDGTSEEVDLIVWATGYRPSFPMLDDGILDWRGLNPNLFLNVFHRERDDLAVLGLIETDAGAWPQMSLQGRMLAHWLRVRDSDPAQAAAFRRLRSTTVDLEGGIEHVDSPRHAYYLRNDTYLALAREMVRQFEEGVVTGDELEVGAMATLRRRLRNLLPA